MNAGRLVRSLRRGAFSLEISEKKNTKASAVMLSSLLELFAYGLLAAFNSQDIGDAIIRGLNPFYELLLSIGL